MIEPYKMKNAELATCPLTRKPKEKKQGCIQVGQKDPCCRRHR